MSAADRACALPCAFWSHQSNSLLLKLYTATAGHFLALRVAFQAQKMSGTSGCFTNFDPGFRKRPKCRRALASDPVARERFAGNALDFDCELDPRGFEV